MNLGSNEFQYPVFLLCQKMKRTIENNINEKRATELSQALMVNTTLTELYLGCEEKRQNATIRTNRIELINKQGP